MKPTTRSNVPLGGTEETPSFVKKSPAAVAGPERCHAGSDGDCFWAKCPQARDAEPLRTGRHCPLDLPYIDEMTDPPSAALPTPALAEGQSSSTPALHPSEKFDAEYLADVLRRYRKGETIGISDLSSADSIVRYVAKLVRAAQRGDEQGERE